MATTNTIYVRTTRAKLKQTLALIPSVVTAGGATADAMMTRCGLTALGRIKAAFVVKARGGTDEAGDRWQPLAPSTIVNRMRRKRTAAQKRRPVHPSQALNSRQQARWWDVYRRGLAIYKGNKAHAAARAWLILRAEGAVTLFDKYANSQVEILRDTGILLNSLSPGVTSAEQIFKVGPGEVIVGTNRVGASWHHEGKENCPQRRLWPEPDRWPSRWWDDILEQGRMGLIDVTIQLIRSL